jgi:hypothetical protein
MIQIGHECRDFVPVIEEINENMSGLLSRPHRVMGMGSVNERWEVGDMGDMSICTD